jgi:UDP-glucose 4-epimerase
MYYRLHMLRTVSLRYFNVYGPRQPLKGPYAPVIGLFQEQKRRGEPMTIVGDGEQRRDFTHVDDVVEANICAMNNLISIESINIGTGTNYSMNQVADMIGGDRVYIPARKGESRETLADISRAKSMLGWEPKITLEDQLTNHDQL